MSDKERINNTALNPKGHPLRDPSLITDTEILSHNSNPDLSSTGNDFIETPIGRGPSTRLQVGREGGGGGQNRLI